MRQGQRSSVHDLRHRVDRSSRKGTGVVALLTGIVAFAVGLVLGWMLHRERVGGDDGPSERSNDLATSALANTSALLEEADQDVVELRTQLSEAQRIVEQHAATIEELEHRLAQQRGADEGAEAAAATDADADAADDTDDETLAIAPADAEEPAAGAPSAAAPEEPSVEDDAHAVDDAPATAVLADVDIDEVDVTEEVMVDEPAVADDTDEIPDAERTRQDLSATYDITEVIPAQPVGVEGAEAEETQAIPVDDTEVVVVSEDDTVSGPDADAASEVTVEVTTDTPARAVAAAADEPAGEEPVSVEPGTSDADIVGAQPPVAEEPATADAGIATEADNLRRIRGIGPAMERLLNDAGVSTYRQLAVLDDAAIAELQTKLPGVAGRIQRGNWIKQAHELHVESYGEQP